MGGSKGQWKLEAERKREEKLDSYSDPPSEDALYGSRFFPVIAVDGCVVGEWDHVEREVDAVALARTNVEPYVNHEESRLLGLEIRERRAHQLAVERAAAEKEERERLRQQVEAEHAAVKLALKKMDKRDKAERRAQERYRKIALGLIDPKTGRKTEYPFGPPVGRWVAYEPERVIVDRPESETRVAEYTIDGLTLLIEAWRWNEIFMEAIERGVSFDDVLREKIKEARR